MEKRYQVFVSSTFTDLKDERRHVIQTLMEMDCIPAGMELFPAMDEEQFNFIRKVIDDSDYYLLIVGGRYGSVTPEGVSYTEKEYDYAVSKGMKVLALLHGQPDEIPVGKSDVAPELREKLNAFRAKVGTGRLVKFWTRGDELPGLVALSLPKTIKTHPAVGWVRASSAASADVLAQVNALRQANDALTAENQQLRAERADQLPAPALADLAGLDDKFTIHGTSAGTYGGKGATERSWRQIFATIGPYLASVPTAGFVKDLITRDFRQSVNAQSGYNHAISDQDFQTIGLQLKALGLVDIQRLKTTAGGYEIFWSITPKGEPVMLESRLIRSTARDEKKTP